MDEHAPLWYLHTSEGPQGPYDSATLRAWLADGQVTADTYLWRDGMAEWVRLDSVADFAAPPPPPPPAVPEKKTVFVPLAPSGPAAPETSFSWLRLVLLIVALGGAGYYVKAEYADVPAAKHFSTRELSSLLNGLNPSAVGRILGPPATVTTVNSDTVSVIWAYLPAQLVLSDPEGNAARIVHVAFDRNHRTGKKLLTWEAGVGGGIAAPVTEAASATPAGASSGPEIIVDEFELAVCGRQTVLDARLSRGRQAGGPPLSFRWLLQQSPAGGQATLIDAESPTAGFSAAAPGEYTVRLSVSQGRSESARDVRIAVVPPYTGFAALPNGSSIAACPAAGMFIAAFTPAASPSSPHPSGEIRFLDAAGGSERVLPLTFSPFRVFAGQKTALAFVQGGGQLAVLDVRARSVKRILNLGSYGRDLFYDDAQAVLGMEQTTRLFSLSDDGRHWSSMPVKENRLFAIDITSGSMRHYLEPFYDMAGCLFDTFRRDLFVFARRNTFADGNRLNVQSIPGIYRLRYGASSCRLLSASSHIDSAAFRPVLPAAVASDGSRLITGDGSVYALTADGRGDFRLLGRLGNASASEIFCSRNGLACLRTGDTLRLYDLATLREHGSFALPLLPENRRLQLLGAMFANNGKQLQVLARNDGYAVLPPVVLFTWELP